MQLEIERKFLVRSETWKQNAEVGQVLKQGYLSLDKERTVRVRIKNDQAFLTIKGKTIKTTRKEFEYEIPFNDGMNLLKLCHSPIIEKTRFNIPFQGQLWELDVFEGENKGLIVAEIELESEDQNFEMPDWVGEEVSDDSRYFNANLVEHPFCDWV